MIYSSPYLVGSAATNAWYDEIKMYDFSQGGYSDQTGHFNQVVWKNSHKLGAGVAYNSGRTKYYVVARYTPADNHMGQFTNNILPANC